MTTTELSKDVTDLLIKIVAADVVKINENVFECHSILKREDYRYLINKIAEFEDYLVAIETKDFGYTLWEVLNDSTKLNEREWRVGQDILSFYLLKPV